jgi:hypothetical protein
MVNCSICGIKLYEWEENKIGDVIYCEECYEYAKKYEKDSSIRSENNIAWSFNQENEKLTKPKQRRIKKDKVVKISVALVIIIILLGFVSIGGYYYLDNTYTGLKEEKDNLEAELITTQNQLEIKNSQLNLSNSELEQAKNNLQENISELNSLKSGNEFQLHDPLYSEVVNFIEVDDSENEKILVEQAKKQGIRCAYVEINIVGSTVIIMPLEGETSSTGGMYPLVGFNTVDEGLVYYESVTDYRVFPEIGKSYLDCVEGSPYWSGFFSFTNYTITDILIIW